MQEQKKMEKLYILCGLSNEAGSALRSALAEKAGELGSETVCSISVSIRSSAS